MYVSIAPYPARNAQQKTTSAVEEEDDEEWALVVEEAVVPEEKRRRSMVDDDARFFEGVFSKRGSFFHVKFRVFFVFVFLYRFWGF